MDKNVAIVKSGVVYCANSETFKVFVKTWDGVTYVNVGENISSWDDAQGLAIHALNGQSVDNGSWVKENI